MDQGNVYGGQADGKICGALREQGTQCRRPRTVEDDVTDPDPMLLPPNADLDETMGNAKFRELCLVSVQS